MRVLLITLTAFLVGQPLCAANTLTPEEARAGWLLLFDGETTFGWNTTGEVEVVNGVLQLGGTKETRVVHTAALHEFDLEFDYRVKGEGVGRAWFNLGSAGGDGDGAGLPPTNDAGWYRAVISIRAESATGERRIFTQVTTPMNTKASDFVVHVNAEKPYRPRYACLRVKAGSQLFLRSVKLRPHGFKSIFNGKDLTGWNIHPGRKSKFTVTKEGWLNVKDGNGDLQSEGQWADFVLQLECISNGKHLNSGIFFRCRPGEYQMGYEAQIRNEFTAKPTQKYLVEEYDPKTHALKGKKEVLSPAVDFGTGAIYRRQPARRGVAKDGEWFTLTVVAHGRHFATWVDGIQVADWTDHRKPNDNARNGYRAEKGPISIQGHDPTTDLSFRNLRIVELPPVGEKK